MAAQSTDSTPIDQSDVLIHYRKLCNQYNIILIIGSLHILDIDTNKLCNRQYILSPDHTSQLANITATYDKIHMFDVQISDSEQYNESARFISGQQSPVVYTPHGNIGLTICYDIRFPSLYRELAQCNAHIITVPAAFTVHTGKLHWHTLLRARAIECGCYIIAAAQCGTHNNTRFTYGHSLIIAPDGSILNENTSDDISYIYSDIDISNVIKQRQLIPAWNQQQSFTVATINAPPQSTPFKMSDCPPKV